MTSYLDNKYTNLLIKSLNSHKEPIEFEIKFKKFKGKSLDFNEFYRVKSYLESIYGVVEPKRTEDFIINGKNTNRVNERLTLVNTHTGSYYTKIIKTGLWDDVDRDINFKASVSTEVDQTVDEPYTEWDITRTKTRYSWVDNKKNLKFDVTIVIQTPSEEQNKQVYEVEMESIHPIFLTRTTPISETDIKALKEHLFIASQEMLKLILKINDTDDVYKSNERYEVANFINQSLNAKKYITRPNTKIMDGEMFSEIDTRARNLQFRDMVYGGLLSKKSKTEGITDDPNSVGYSVTIKAEGLRKFLVIHSTGIWLVYKSEFCKVANLVDSWKEFVNTIIDGEDIRDVKNRKDYFDYNHYYLPFDTLVFKGIDVTTLPLIKRREFLTGLFRLETLIYRNRNSLILENKPFIYFEETPESFYKALNQILSYKTSYVTDGLIFTPNRCVYNPLSQRLNDRVLTKAPDICKWKPLEELTIDLAYCVSPSGNHLCYSKRDLNIPFKGDRINPFDSEKQVDWMDKIFEELPLDTVVEFEIKMVHNAPYKNEDGNYVLKPKKIRWDKRYPNGKETADNVWKDIHDPISMDTLLGNDLRLVRKYHNKVKRKIFNVVAMGSNLIDIGSGFGGDIDKMKKFDKILCIEPSTENLKKFVEERLPNTTDEMRDKINILKAGGEETKRIFDKMKEVFGPDIGKKNLYISFMLSLSFFWRDKIMLGALVQTINVIRNYYYTNGGKDPIKIVFLTIEGERAFKLLENYDFKIKNAAYNMSYDETSGEVSIDIKNSIVRDQIEYLVNLKQLKELLDAKSIVIKPANEERFLSSIEKEFTSMYVYGFFEIDKLKNDTYEPENSTSTFFDCLFKAINPKDDYNFVDVLMFRKELSESINEPNPYNESKSFFESADEGILSKISKTPEQATEWIFSDNELPPEYVTWVPDMIGYDLVINNVEYLRTKRPDDKRIIMKYEGKYSLI